MGCFEEWVAMPRQVTVALIICQDEDNVGPLPSVEGVADQGTQDKEAAADRFHGTSLTLWENNESRS